MSKVITRFAPSPTGFLHIGGARTALFNWLFAKHAGGQYLLRVEDTDRERSTPEAIKAILKGLDWLGLIPDAPPIFQSKNLERHVAVAKQLYEKGQAYYCHCSPEALHEMREKARAEGRQPGYDGRCRDKGYQEGALRLKMPREGKTLIHDLVQGEVTLQHAQLDDLILLRSDGTPTYLLSVVVDDFDMGITHVIRGDDHLVNTFRQEKIYAALGWGPPKFAHIPLIHGEDGAKLSKRHGALGVDAYQEMGYLPEAMCNYLLRLGWSHGNDEIISRAQAIEWFSLENVGKGAARFDFKKLSALNAHYIREEANASLMAHLKPFLEKKYGQSLTPAEESLLIKGLPGLKQRAQTLLELGENALFYLKPQPTDEKAQKFLTPENMTVMQRLKARLETHKDWEEGSLEALCRAFAEKEGLGLGKIAQPLRVLLTGKTVSPSVFDIMAVFGKARTLQRLQHHFH